MNFKKFWDGSGGFPGDSEGKESACNAGDWVRFLGQEDSLEKGMAYPLQYSCPENSMDRGAWQAIVHGVTRVEYDCTHTRTHTHTHTHIHAHACTHTHDSGRRKRGEKQQRILGKAGQDVNKLAGNVKSTGSAVNLETHQKDHLDSSLRHWGRKIKGYSDQQLIGFPKSTQFY